MNTTRKLIVFLTGAGISAESGLTTFRGKDGMWSKEEFQYLASLDCLYHEPEKCLDFYNMRRKRLSEVEPCDAHRLISELEQEYDVTVITQNVDDLHERAGTGKIVHLHGELTKVCSSKNRYDPSYIRPYPLTTPIRVGDDAGDSSQLRPYVVMFGEYVLGIEVAVDIVKEADIFVVVGTSLMVFPANILIMYTKEGIPKYVIDPEDIPKCDALGYKHIKASASDGMRMLKEEIKDKLNEGMKNF